MSFSSNAATTVWMAMRSLGGVSITLKSRTPVSDMCSVRGMGVAESVSTSTSFFSCLQPLLVAHAEALLFVHHHQPEVGELEVLGEQAVRADQNVHLPGLDLSAGSLSAAGRCGSGSASRS